MVTSSNKVIGETDCKVWGGCELGSFNRAIGETDWKVGVGECGNKF